MNALTFTALAEPHRLSIVEFLREGPATVADIAKGLFLRQPQTSKHLQVLREAGLVSVKPIAQQRIYALQAQPFQEIESWLETYKPTWEARLDVMEAYLQTIKD
jgi:DNA-binding transcriptional ArsR family regulator